MAWAEPASFLLLAGGLATFLLSARQFSLKWRLPIWLCGAAMIGGAAWLAATMEGHFGLFRAVADFFAHIREPEESVLVQAFSRNAPSVARFVLPLLDLFLTLAALLGLLALFAFTPGERVEKMVRPLAHGAIGALAGAVLALSIVGIGFGGVAAPRLYAGNIVERDVYDGDTFWIGETSLRLYGVDAPERGQRCRDGAACGELARRKLVELLSGAIVSCETMTTRSGRVSESFGRPLVRCEISPERGEKFDLGARLIQLGYAGVYRDEHPDDYGAISAKGGLCWLEASQWRKHRRNGAEQEQLMASPENLAGYCLAGEASAVRGVSSDNPR